MDVPAPSTVIETEFLMTYGLLLDVPYAIDDSLMIFNVKAEGGWVRGPKVHGTLVPPGGDWLQVLPSGALRLDVRATLKTDDDALIYMSYNGIINATPDVMQRLQRGDRLVSAEIPYFITAPTFRTAAPKYAWLNSVQAVGKVVELQFGARLIYDVFLVR